jgi:plasmid stabilization system protein ParE
MKVVYLKSALKDLAAIRAYIGREDAEAARRVVTRIEQCVERLASLPYSGRPGPRRMRLLTVPGLPYVVIHRVQDETVKIAGVLHTSRNRQF